MLQALAQPAAELSILICDDATIHQLNRDHRGKDRPTDVLAFAMREGPALQGPSTLLGDVVISLPTALRQARARRRSLWDEVTLLLAHGLLHLLGFDHRDDREEREMNRQAALLCAAAVARPAANAAQIAVDKRPRGVARGHGRASDRRRRSPG